MKLSDFLDTQAKSFMCWGRGGSLSSWTEVGKMHGDEAGKMNAVKETSNSIQLKSMCKICDSEPQHSSFPCKASSSSILHCCK